MTVSTLNSSAEFATNGVTTVFPIGFKFLAAADLNVTYTNSAGVTTDLVLGTDYTVSGAGSENGGSITTTTALATGQLGVERDMLAYQETSLRNQGRFFAETHEQVFDRLTMLIQQLFGRFARVLLRPLGRNYYDAQGRQISNLGEPSAAQDATTLGWVQQYIGSILSTGQGPVNNAANVLYVAPDGTPKVVQDIATPQGAGLVGYDSLQTYPSGTAGKALKDLSGQVAPLILKFKDQFHMADWGIVGAPDYQTAAPNEGAKLQQAFTDVSSVSGTLIGDAKNYLTDRQLVLSGNFRSFKLQGPGTGNSQTASTGGMTLMTNGLYSAIRAEMSVFANENIRVEGVNFYNIARGGLAGSALRTLLASAAPAIKVVHGATSARYHSGFVFRDVGIMGYGAGIDFQGLNTTDAGLNFFGTTICDNVSMTDVGLGYLIANASLNLLDLRSPLLHNCPFGGIVLVRDGEVGPGNGRGSSVNVHIGGKPHFEGVGGMFRTQTTRTFGGTGTSETLRSTITIEGLRHEFCGDTINADTGIPTGDPFAIGVDTDLIIIGDVNYGMGYQEVAYGAIPAGCTVTSSTPTRLNITGGRILSPRMVNAPIIRRIIAAGASTTITLRAQQVDTPFSLKSQLILSGGQAGFIESFHRGIPSGAKATTSNASPIPGITAAFGSGASGDVISLVVTNGSSSPISAELQIENLSSCTILEPSEL